MPLANTTDIAVKFEWEVPADDFPGYPLMYYLMLCNLLIEHAGFKVFNRSSVTLWPLARNYSHNLLVREREREREGGREGGREGERGKIGNDKMRMKY